MSNPTPYIGNNNNNNHRKKNSKRTANRNGNRNAANKIANRNSTKKRRIHNNENNENENNENSETNENENENSETNENSENEYEEISDTPTQYLDKVKDAVRKHIYKLFKAAENAENAKRRNNGKPLNKVSFEDRFNISYPSISYHPWYDFDTIDIEIKDCQEETQLKSGWHPWVTIKNIRIPHHHVYPLEMHIDILTPCAPISGSKILEGFINVARELMIRYVTLDDASTVYYGKYGTEGCNVSLAILEILVAGRSWYYDNGFRNHNNNEWLAHNVGVSLMPFYRFMNWIVWKEMQEEFPKTLSKNQIKMISQNKQELIAAIQKKVNPVLQAIYAEIKSNFPEIDLKEDAVSDAVSKMIKSMPKDKIWCDSKKLEILQRIVDGCTLTPAISPEPIIKYDPFNLMLTLPLHKP